MAADEVMQLTSRLLTQAGAVGALAARIRLQDLDVDADPEVRARLDEIVECLGARQIADTLDERERAIVVGFARAFLTFALDVVDDPARASGWGFSDPGMLQSIGAGSAIIARLIANAGIDAMDGRVLDVGAGVGALSIAFARTFEGSTVVGLEPWEPSRALAVANVTAAGLDDRITFVPQVIEAYDETAGFDLVWLPGPFLGDAILDGAIARATALARAGGHVVLGTFGATGEPLADAVANLRTVRFGGSVLAPGDAMTRLAHAGLIDVREIERTWNAPVGLAVGRRA